MIPNSLPARRGWLRSSAPAGHATRGFTAANRLRKLDAYLLQAHEARLRTPGALVVDLGFGASPVTTLELAARLRRLNPSARVLGVELDPARVEAAMSFASETIAFRRGGFNLPLRADERPLLVRAMNVLRQYEESECAEALGLLASTLPDGAIVVEGTCDPPGRFLTAQEHRVVGDSLVLVSTLLATKPSLSFAPRRFQEVLPRPLIQQVAPGSATDHFFAAWERAWLAAAGIRRSRARFAMAAGLLASDYPVERRPAAWERGILTLGPGWPARRHGIAGNGRLRA